MARKDRKLLYRIFELGQTLTEMTRERDESKVQFARHETEAWIFRDMMIYMTIWNLPCHKCQP